MTGVPQSEGVLDPESASARASETGLLARLRAGDEGAFEELIERYHTSLLRLAQLYVPSRAVAEDVVQETWLGVLRGLSKFEGRSSLKTWIFHILVNRARTRGQREGRSVSFSDLAATEDDLDEPTVDPAQFWPADHPQWAQVWVAYPRSWNDLPEQRLLSQETFEQLRQAIDDLPPTQREVITLRDVDGWSSEEVCNVLEISESNQRVLLHRARAKVRRALHQYLTAE